MNKANETGRKASQDSSAASNPDEKRGVVLEPDNGKENPDLREVRKPVSEDLYKPAVMRLRDGTLMWSDEWARRARKKRNTPAFRAEQRKELLKHIVKSRRRPEDKRLFEWVEKKIKQLETKGSADVPAETDRLKSKIRESLQASLQEGKGFNSLICREAFLCGIPPESLLVPVTPERKKKLLEALAEFDKAATRRECQSAVSRMKELAETRLKGKEFARRLVRSARDPDQWPKFAPDLLEPIPSVAAVEILCKGLHNEGIDQEVKVEFVRLIGETWMKSAKDCLLDFVSRRDLEFNEVVAETLLDLGGWTYLPEVRRVLEKHLLSGNGEDIVEVVDSFWGVKGGLDALEELARSASSQKVRVRALEVLEMHSFQPQAASVLWKIVADEGLAESLRAKALNRMSSVVFNKGNPRLEKIKEWAEGTGPLANSAREYVVDLNLEKPLPSLIRESDGGESGPESEDLSDLVWVWRGLEREERHLLKKQELRPIEKERLRQLQQRTENLEEYLNKCDPSGKWRAFGKPESRASPNISTSKSA
ncbi:MAG: hypothetical protein KGZ25_11955 [Planctomycetes bacterium]|nr:hypothetical protein [Planctomycetota bacterium]